MARMLCSCIAVRMRRAARRCHSQCSPFIPSGLQVPICATSQVATQCHRPGWSMVLGGACGPARWPKATSAIVLVLSPRWRECEVSSHRMLTATASGPHVVILSIHRSRSWAAACTAWALDTRA